MEVRSNLDSYLADNEYRFTAICYLVDISLFNVGTKEDVTVLITNKHRLTESYYSSPQGGSTLSEPEQTAAHTYSSHADKEGSPPGKDERVLS